MHDDDVIPEMRTKAPHSLRCQRDLRHENDCAPSLLLHIFERFNIDLCLAAACDSMKKEHSKRFIIYGMSDRVKGTCLVICEGVVRWIGHRTGVQSEFMP